MVVISMFIMVGFIVPTAAKAQKTIKIGALYPLTGGTAAAGRELRAGVELAVEIANQVMTDIDINMAKNAGRGQI